MQKISKLLRLISVLFAFTLVIVSCRQENIKSDKVLTELNAVANFNSDSVAENRQLRGTAGVVLFTITAQPTSVFWGQIFGISLNVKIDGKNQPYVPVNALLNSGLGAIQANMKGVTDANGNVTFPLKITDKIVNGKVTSEGLGNHSIKFETGGGNIISKNINVLIPSGWSDVTGFRHTWTPNQAAILNVARQYFSRSNAPASTIVSGQTWQNDTEGGDGQRIINAITNYHNFRKTNPSSSQPNTATLKAMNDALSATYVSADRTSIINRIIAVYNGTVPTSNAGVLSYLSIRSQCKETRDKICRDAVGRSAVYNGASAVARKNVRAGMIGNWNTNRHTFIIAAVKWDANGTPTNIKCIDSNWGGGFNNPAGDLPWSRIMRQHEKEISFASHIEEF